VLICTFRC